MMTNVGTQMIETERLILRRFEYVDCEAMLKNWIADEKIQSMYSEPVYTTQGHSEYTLSETFTTALEKENVETESINLMNFDTIPEDAACLIINAPSSDLSTDDKEKVIAYLERGGKVITNTMYTENAMPNYKEILAYMGITLVDGLVLEGNRSNYYQIPFYLLPEIKYGDYTTGIYNTYYVFAPYAQGMQLAMEDESFSYTEILKTSDNAYAKTNLTNADDYAKEEGDVDGPFILGVEAVKELEEGEATMVVYSCSELFTDSTNQMVSGANQLLFTNTVSQFVKQEISTSIPVKSYELSYLTITQKDMLTIAGITVLAIPLGSMILGLVIWFRRRKR